MRRFSCIIGKSNQEQYFSELTLKTPLEQSYCIDVLDQVNTLIASDGFMLPAKWGLSPSSDEIKMPFIDFRQVHVKPSFRLSFRTQRSIVIADSFYAWHDSKRRPLRLHLHDALMFFPAIYFKTGDGSFGFTIISRPSRKSLREYSDLEPVIFDRESALKWLDFLPVTQVIKLLQTTLPVPFENHLVSQKIFVKGFSGKVLHEPHQEQALLF
ncbi:MAG: SOS response-associated peptidase family protein [Saprospiraceae bacterium]|nr:SOS response-associated peptidase family protein [Saprospiraceae bacterium]